MKANNLLLKPLVLVAGALCWSGLNLPAQTAPTITNQPASQTCMVGTSVNFSVGVTGTGPFTFQWQFNGASLPNNLITTLAGNGIATNAGDGGPALSASLNNPSGAAFDAFGNLYLADTGNQTIRKVNTNGVIATVAGIGSATYSGDGGPATNAGLAYPASVVFDALGNFYIADAGNNLVRRVDTNGYITTVAGNGTNGYAGYGGAATNASLAAPTDIAFDFSGNLYIADSTNNCIRRVDTNGFITTVAGGGGSGYAGDFGPATNATLNGASGVTLDASGNLFIADTLNNCIRRVDTNGVITTVAGGTGSGYAGDNGPATNATLNGPSGVTLDASGNLFIADQQNNCIRRVDTNGIITTVAGNGIPNYAGDGGAATNASLDSPRGLAFDPAGNLLIADTANNRIRKVLLAGQPTLTLNNLGATNSGYYTVIISSSYGSVTSSVAMLTVAYPPSIITQPASLTNPAASTFSFSVTVAGTGPLTYQWQLNGTNLPNNLITTVAGNGTANYAGDGGVATNANLNTPYGEAFDAFGNLYIADDKNHRIRKVDINGFITTVAGNGTAGFAGDGYAATNAHLDFPEGVAFDLFGNLYIADSGNNRIRMVDTNGIITTMAGYGSYSFSGDGGAATNAGLRNPSDLAFDIFGNLYIADYSNNRIRKVNTNGIITTVAGNGTASYSGDGGAATNASLYEPTSVACDAFGNLYAADYRNNRIRRVDTNGTITTVAGNGTGGLSGDGGAATNAGINCFGVVLDIFNDIYVSDNGNCRIRMVDANGFITTLAGRSTGGYSGDGGLATEALIWHPLGLNLDAFGNLYFADSSNNRIRKVLLYAGHPTLTLNNINATNSGNCSVVITSPYGSVTSSVAIWYRPPFISVQPANQVVVVGSNATMSVTVTGFGPFGYQWYFAATNLVQTGTNNTFALPVFFTNNAGNYLVIVTNPYGSVTSQIASLTAAVPPTVARQPASQTNLVGASAILNVLASGPGPFTYQWQFNGTNLPNNLITTVAGNGTNGFSGDGGPATNASLGDPYGVTFDSYGNLYIGDILNERIRKVNTNGIITTVAGSGARGSSGDSGAATQASFFGPMSVAFDVFGNLYIADTENSRIRKVSTNGIINTVAGNGTAGFAGDGGSATKANLNFPYGIAVDVASNLYIADTSNLRIRKVNTNGVIFTIAGKTATGYSGDGGAATNAAIYDPYSVALDNLGNVLIADENNNRVRKVDTNGIITTVAGNGNGSYSGDGGLATSASLHEPIGVACDTLNNLYIADILNYRVRRVDTSGFITTVAGNGTNAYSGDGGLATNASLAGPRNLAFDNIGNLYIADPGNQRIREVFLYAEYPTLTLQNLNLNNAGNYSVVISNPYGSVTSSVVSLTVWLPPAISVQPVSQIVTNSSSPNFSVTATGTLPLSYSWYFTGTNLLQTGTNNSLTLSDVSANNTGGYTVIITNICGAVTSTVANLTVALPPAITAQPASQTNLAGTSVVFNLAVSGIGPFSYQWLFNGTNIPNNNIITTVAGNGTNAFYGDGGPATNASLWYPQGVAFDPAGNLFIADNNNDRVRKVDTSGIITTVAGNGSGASSGGGSFSGDSGPATNAGLYRPNNVTFDAAGNWYIADIFNNRVRRVDTNGIITTVAGTSTFGYSGDGGSATNAGLGYPADVAFDAVGNWYIADLFDYRVRKVDLSGVITTVAGNGGTSFAGDGGLATNASLYRLQGVALDADGNLYIADTGLARIRKVDTNGFITTVAGEGGGFSGDGGTATNATLSQPWFLSFDSLGNYYIADYGNNRIRKVDTNGIITTVVGNGAAGFAGDGGVATNASLNGPASLAFDPLGNLYIADWYNNRIREVHFAGYPILSFSNVLGSAAGNYSVIVTSPYGSATSAVASLTVTVPTTPPQIVTNGVSFGFATNQSGFGFNLSGAYGQTIEVDGSTNLMDWIPLFTNTAGYSPFYFLDPTTTNFPGRFYRARLQ